jgi:hypothetical protein
MGQGPAVQNAKPLSAVGCLEHGATFVLEDVSQHGAEVGVVIDDEDSSGACHGGSSRGAFRGRVSVPSQKENGLRANAFPPSSSAYAISSGLPYSLVMTMGSPRSPSEPRTCSQSS